MMFSLEGTKILLSNYQTKLLVISSTSVGVEEYCISPSQSHDYYYGASALAVSLHSSA